MSSRGLVGLRGYASNLTVRRRNRYRAREPQHYSGPPYHWVDTVARFERGDELKERTIEALQRVLEAAGIEFIDGEGSGPGVRLSGKSKRETRKK